MAVHTANSGVKLCNLLLSYFFFCLSYLILASVHSMILLTESSTMVSKTHHIGISDMVSNNHSHCFHPSCYLGNSTQYRENICLNQTVPYLQVQKCYEFLNVKGFHCAIYVLTMKFWGSMNPKNLDVVSFS